MDKNRIAQAHNPVGPTLMFRQLTGREEVSRLFEWQLELLAENNANIRPEDLLGRDITIELQTQTKGSRFLNGQVTRFAFVGKEVAEDTDLWRYEARLSPWLWYLTRESDFRIFQNKTVPDILDEIFGKYPFPVEKRLTGQYRQWEYCVQYQETDFNFVSRLMEGEGIFYFFDHAMGRHTLVLADDVSVLTPCPNGYGSIPYIPHDRVAVADEECVDDVRMWQQIEPGMYVSDDFDFQKPRAELMRRRMEVVPYPQGDHALYQWPGGYTELDDGDNYAKVHLEELQMPRETVMFQCNARGVAAGRLFTLKTCPRKDLNREYVILGTSFYVRDNPYHSGGEGGGSQWRFGVTAQPTSLPYRPQRVTPKPLTSGPQTAIVVGPAGRGDPHRQVRPGEGPVPLGPVRPGRRAQLVLDPGIEHLGRSELGQHLPAAHRAGGDRRLHRRRSRPADHYRPGVQRRPHATVRATEVPDVLDDQVALDQGWRQHGFQRAAVRRHQGKGAGVHPRQLADGRAGEVEFLPDR